MKRWSLKELKMAALITLVVLAGSCYLLREKSSDMYEVAPATRTESKAPAEALSTFQDFFEYVRKVAPSILSDEEAQNRWLSRSMKRDFVEYIARSGKPEENPDFPSNNTFVGVWNRPTTFSILGSRHYDFRDSDNPNDNRAIVDVLYEWDPVSNGLDNQYPGEKCMFSFVFVQEEGLWKLDDIYTYDDEYMSAGSLRRQFRP